MDFDFVTARLATGEAPKTPDDVRRLIEAGITHVIDTWAEEDHADAYAGSRLVRIRNPTLDDGEPKASEWFERSIVFAVPALALPKARIYAHCAAGVNRGPSTAYAILRCVGFSPDDAERRIVTQRPRAQLRYKGDAERAIAALYY